MLDKQRRMSSVMIPIEHQNFINRAVEILKQDGRIAGAALGGSYITGIMDEFSDLDFVIAVYPEFYGQMMNERMEIAGKLGVLLSAFTGEHVGEPRLVICLYDFPLIHVDLKFVSLADAARRIEDPIILYQKDDIALAGVLSEEAAAFPLPDIQWIEDRFWVWVHYGAGKIGRGELFEAMEHISFLRQTVIAPLILMKNGKLPRGVRKIESDAPYDIPGLLGTVAVHDARSCFMALKKAAELYVGLRKQYTDGTFQLRDAAEEKTMAYLEDVGNKVCCN